MGKRHLPVQHQLSSKIFRIELILEKIASKCSLETLKNFRLINKKCHAVSKFLWLEKSVLCVGSYEGWGKVSLVELMRTKKVIQVKNAKVVLNLLFEGSCRKIDLAGHLQEKFWPRYGSGLKYLHLSECGYNQSMLLKILLQHARNLETLVIDKLNYHDDDMNSDISNFKAQKKLKVFKLNGFLPFKDWTFLNAFPNLENIELGNLCSPLISDLAGLRRENRNILQLKSLDMIQSIETFDDFTDCRLSLLHFTIQLYVCLSDEALSDILASQCKSLLSLKLLIIPHLRQPFTNFPYQLNFPHIQELHMWGAIVSNLNFLYWMPSLKKVKIDLQCREHTYKIHRLTSFRPTRDRVSIEDVVVLSDVLLRVEKFEHINIQEFKIDYEFSAASLEIFSRWTPNLKILSCIFNRSLQPVLRKRWQKLERVVTILT